MTTTSAPRWTVRSIMLSATITLGMYLLLPYLETLSSLPEQDTTVRSVETTRLAPPAPPPPPRTFEKKEPLTDVPRPELTQPRQQLSPVEVSMSLEMALGDIGGDFAVNFGVEQNELAGQIRELIFDIGDLDNPPRPLARLNPVYPPRARMRRIEGEVVVEFVVDPDGTVRNVEVISSRPGDLFTSAATRAIQRWRFSPGTREGSPVATRVRQKVTFSLQ
jgi:protein TonB